MVRIGFDARPLAMSKAGIGTCITSLVDYLLDQDVECVLFADGKLQHEFGSNSNVSCNIFTASHRVIWEQFLLPGRIARQKLDLYHATWNYGLPVKLPCPTVLTIHDLIPLVVPGYFSSWKERIVHRSVYRTSLEVSVRKADVITADSENSRNDIHRLLGVSLAKIRVVPQGLGPVWKRIPDKVIVKQSLSKVGLEGDYIIYTGGFDRRKNIGLLLAAFANLLRFYRKELRLVLTGEKNFFYPEIERQAVELGIQDRTVFTGYIADEEMPALVAGARILVYPSLYEGFGLPPLEAMACGTPVVASKASSLPEIVGDAGLLVDPSSVEDISRAMLKLLEDERLCSELVAKGLKRAQLFRAEDSAERTLAVYKEILGEDLFKP